MQDKREICSELESIREIEKNTVSKSRRRLPYHSDLLTAARPARQEGALLRIGDTQPHIKIRQPLTPFPFHRSLLAVGGASCKNIDTWPNRKVRVPARSPLTVCCRWSWTIRFFGHSADRMFVYNGIYAYMCALKHP